MNTNKINENKRKQEQEAQPQSADEDINHTQYI